MPPLLLYHFAPSGPSRGALLAARQLQLPVEVKTIDLFSKQQLTPEFVKINPQHTVPTLVDDDFVLWDGHAISSYLVTKHGQSEYQSLYPEDPQKRALVNNRLFFDVGVLYARIRAICFPVLFLGVTEVAQDKVDNLDEAVGWLEGFLTDSPWVAGPDLTIADTSLLASMSSVLAAGYDVGKCPRITQWLARCEKEVKGFAENARGADIFGTAVRSKLAPGQSLSKL